MEEKKSNVEIYEDESVIELFDENEQAVQFREIASIELDGKFYELLQPVEPMEGIGEDEAVIFEYTEGEDDERNFTPLFNEKLLERIFDEYLKAASELDCDCCDCEDCNGEHECHHGDHDCKDGDCDCGCHHHEK